MPFSTARSSLEPKFLPKISPKILSSRLKSRLKHRPRLGKLATTLILDQKSNQNIDPDLEDRLPEQIKTQNQRQNNKKSLAIRASRWYIVNIINSRKERKMSNLIENLEGEVWKDLVGFDEYKGLYQVSNMGRVKRLASLQRDTNRKTRLPEHILKPYLTGTGYRHIRLCCNGEQQRVLVHRLVALAFVDGDKSLIVNHINFNKSDNRACNLEWVSYAYNLAYVDEQKAGKKRSARIPKDRIDLWRSLLEQGHSITYIQKHYGACMPSVRKHLPEFFN